ncbi:protease inhibitor I42 family protein [Clostridia bacterium OttesenSCG-928-O13]|nr:protease inhibitor I42 family protein [Clostridia bacterium OttesenSCG-928-O13]
MAKKDVAQKDNQPKKEEGQAKENPSKKKRLAIIAGVLGAVLLAVLGFGIGMYVEQNKDPVHQQVSIILETNPTTGYMWKSWMSGKGAMVLEEHSIGEVDWDLAMAGTPSRETFLFRPSQPGDVDLVFEYEQDWTGGDEVYLVTYSFTVKNNLSVVYKGQKAEWLGDWALEADGEEELVFPEPVIRDRATQS